MITSVPTNSSVPTLGVVIFTPDPTTGVATAVGSTGVTEAVGLSVGVVVIVAGVELGVVVAGNEINISAVGTRVGNSREFVQAIRKNGSNRKQTSLRSGNILARLYPDSDTLTRDLGANLKALGHLYCSPKLGC